MGLETKMFGYKWKKSLACFAISCVVIFVVLGRMISILRSHQDKLPGELPKQENTLNPRGTQKDYQQETFKRPDPPVTNQLFYVQQTTKEGNNTMADIYRKIKQEIFDRSDSEYLTYRDYQEFTTRAKEALGFYNPTSHKIGLDKEPKCNLRRKKLIKKVCKGVKHTKPIHKWTVKDVKKYRHRLANIVVDDRHKILFCEIPKTGCTSWKVAISLLTGRVKKADILNRNFLAVHAAYYMTRLGLYYLNYLNDKAIRKKLLRYYKFLVVRHPLDRVVSAYTDKFIHKDPYFQWYENMKQDIASRYRAEDEDQNATVSFREFVNYATLEDSIKDRHWSNYQTLCSPCMLDYDYVVKVESMEEDARYLLPKMSGDLNLTTLPEAHSHRGASQARKPYKELREFFNITKQETQRLIDGPYKLDFPMFGYRFDAESGRATCDKYTSDGQCC